MTKAPTSYEEQIKKLRERGCIITDSSYCEEVLANVNYYRLSAYFLPYKNNDDTYHKDTEFNTIYNIYEFDRKLRSILFLALEEIEVFLKARIAYYHAHKYGALGYLDESTFNGIHDHDKFRKNIAKEINHNKTTEFVRHHLNNYGGEFPIWVITELFTFSMTSLFYADLKSNDQRKIANSLYTHTHDEMKSWLKCCTDLRNICAHHGRLYFRKYVAVPRNLPSPVRFAERRLFGAIMATKYLHPDSKKWETEIVHPLKILIGEYKDYIKYEHMGFPINWEEVLLDK